MESESELFFAEKFPRLTGREPYAWQRKLFGLFADSTDAWPEIVDLPTGSGKTSVVYVWVLALAWSIRTSAHGVPRRLAWVVNRRVVVDQITVEVVALRERILAAENRELCELLSSVSSSRIPLEISTLRGEFADNGDWRRDPSTPSVVIGTVDMIGSRLLFRGYRASRYFRPIHAGLMGIDTLIVNDEAHLSAAFASLLSTLRGFNPAMRLADKPFRILLLSATHGSVEGLRRFEHEPEEDAAESDRFRAIFYAPKSLSLREVANLIDLEATMWRLATEVSVPRTAVFIEEPEKAARFAERLNKEGRPAVLLTGTMRGFERDRLLQDATFRRFLNDKDSGTEPVWLVCTSAGEVGINFSCERMITRLTEADHLLQRFGRLNRFGSSVPGEAHVVFRKPQDKEARLIETLEYLRSLDGDVSCAKVWETRPAAGARSEAPIVARLETRHIDIWSQTTFRDKAVTPVASWLQGKQDAEAPETEVAWRSDVAYLTAWSIGDDQIGQILEYYPVLSREKLREPAERVAGKLDELLQRIGPGEALAKKVILVESDGTPEIWPLSALVDRTKRNRRFLGFKLLLMPEDLGSVPGGMFSSAAKQPETVLDVADAPGNRMRFVCESGAVTRLPTYEVGSDIAQPESCNRGDLGEFASTYRYRPALIIEDSEGEKSLIYFGARSTKANKVASDIPLGTHQESVAARAGELAECLRLGELGRIYRLAGQIHDNGKGRKVWQYAMGGSTEAPLAKSRSPRNLRLINGYRHELGSLLDALAASGDDLLLHLVASHHAGARPYFEELQYDRENLRRSADESAEAARRYARLQAQYGPWGLAYLESVFKCADGMVSASEGEPASA